MTPDQLAKEVRAWRGSVPAADAATQLGMSKRTYEGIEQGRGFRFEYLLLTTLKHTTCIGRS